MAIIIKEIVVKATIESKAHFSYEKEQFLMELKTEVRKEIKDQLKKELLRNTKR